MGTMVDGFRPSARIIGKMLKAALSYWHVHEHEKIVNGVRKGKYPPPVLFGDNHEQKGCSR